MRAIYEASLATAALVERARALGADAELELRVGRAAPGGGFDSDAGAPLFDAVLSDLEGFDGWENEGWSSWTTTHDFFYALPADGRPVRTSAVFSADAAAPARVEHVFKTKNAHADFALSGTDLRVRVAVATEAALRPREVPNAAVRPSHVRVKQRRSFAHGAWRFDLTRVWSGASRTAAEELRASGAAPRHQVELECADASYREDARDVARSALLRVYDVVAPGDAHAVSAHELVPVGGGARAAQRAPPAKRARFE